VRPLGDARPAWKVLRVLANHLGLAGFEFDSSEQVRDAVGKPESLIAKLSNRLEGLELRLPKAGQGLERVTDVPIYFADALVRRAPSLQETADARAPRARLPQGVMHALGVAPGALVRVRMGEGETVLEAVHDPATPEGCVRVSAAHGTTARLGPMFGALTVEAA
jgi:NADH-quinone oxidoreductase subunit G